jgi:DNA polymerase-3 subunit delta'
VARLLAEQVPEADPATRGAAVTAAAGSPGAALEFVAEDLGKLDTLMRRIAADGDAQFTLRGKLAEEIGARPDRARIAAAFDLARANLAQMVQHAPKDRLPAIVEAHSELVRLTGQAPTYNFDPGLLVMQIGGLLASAGAASQRADA